MGAIGLTACGSNSTKQNTVSNIDTAGKPVAGLSVQSVSAPKLGATITRFSAGNEQASISKRISATVEPSTAQNKLVDYRVFWAIGAEHANESVSDYVIVEQDSDGSTDATVTCVQEFDDDTIVIQVVTRDGGFTATCLVTYEGIASDMSVVPEDNISTVNTAARGDYYELLTGRTYYFDINLIDALGNSAKANNLQIAQSFSDSSYYINLFTGYNGSAGYTVADSGRHDFHYVEFFEGSITNDGKLKIVTRETTVENKSFYGDNSILHYVLSSSTVTNNPNNSQALYSYLYGNSNTISQKTMQVVVTDTLSGLSQTIKFWLIAGVNSVSLSLPSLQF
ncbi:MAG: hypothetical protein VZS12_11910, partial [Ruminococcus bromii]|nr:hypothetical protein [Ruminococcus bromii]